MQAIERRYFPAAHRSRFSRALLCFSIALAAWSVCSVASAVLVHDLAADFTLASNPSGGPADGWGYNNALVLFGGPVGPAVANWNAPDFGPGQPGWEGNLGGVHAGWAKIAQNPLAYDVQNGDILTHAPTSVTWHATAATAGTYDVDISMWMIRNLSRFNTFAVYKNDTGSPLASGTVDNSNSSRAAPLVIPTFQAMLAAGDYLRLDFSTAGPGARDFTGVNFTLTAIPEPSAFRLGLVAIFGVLILGARRQII